MNKLTERKEVNRLALLFSVTYMISYITRINYGAIISEMERATSFSRSMLSLAVTGSFITYGVGQIISGVCGDKLSPKKLISCGLIATIMMNLIIPVCQSPYQMLIVWCINGFAQSFMWPPMVKLMTTLLSEDDYKITTAKVSWGSSFGTIAVYLVSPLIISLFSWRAVFVFSAVCGIIMLFVWNRYSYDTEPAPNNTGIQTNKSEKNTFSLFTPLLFGIMIPIILQGMLRDGITTWMPTYISDTYNLKNVISILTGVVLPLFSIICFQITTKLYMKKFTNPLTCAGVLFAAGTVSAVALLLFTGKNAALSIIFSAMLTGCMHGVNLILICMIPPFFNNRGNVSTVSGILNSCTYIGSAISTYGIAVLSEMAGWSLTLMIWILIALAGTTICFICARPWHNKMMEQ